MKIGVKILSHEIDKTLKSVVQNGKNQLNAQKEANIFETSVPSSTITFLGSF